MRVVLRVFRHHVRQRAARPVRFLRAFHERDSEILLHQRREAELAQTEQPRRDHGVENFARLEPERAPEKAQIEVHSLQDNFLLREHRAERLEIDARERIDQEILLRKGELNEAKLLEVAVQTVRLGVDRDAIDRLRIAGESPRVARRS